LTFVIHPESSGCVEILPRMTPKELRSAFGHWLTMDQKAGEGCFSGPSKNLLAQGKAELMLAAMRQEFI